MKRFLIITMALAALLTSGCAYYNTFYNARKYYSNAMRQLDRMKRLPTYDPEVVPSNVATELENCIKKCSALLDRYPESKWVDDAILLMGKAFYHRREYIQAHTEFKDLTSFFEFSELIPEANYWWGMTMMRLGRIEEAAAQLQLAIDNCKDEEIHNAAILAQAELLVAEERLDDAVKEYLMLAASAKDKNTRVKAQLEAGEILLQLERDEEAEEVFQQVDDMGPNRNDQFQGRFGHAIAIKNQGRFEEAIPIFEDLLNSGSNMHRYSEIRYEIADALFRQDQVEEALEAFEEISTIYPNTEGAARGLFRLAEINFHDRLDWTKAHEFYAKARGAGAKYPEIANVAEKRQMQLQKLIVINKRLETALKAYTLDDSTGEKADSLRARLERRREIFLHRFDPDTAAVDTVKQTGNRRVTLQEDAETLKLNAQALDHYLAAEIFLSDLGVPDTAVAYLQKIHENYFDTKVADRALYLLGCVYLDTLKNETDARKTFETLIEEYPDSKFVNQSRRMLGFEVQYSVNDSLNALVDSTEALFFNPDQQAKAAHIYRTILHDHPDAECAPRVHHLLGIYYEKYLRNPERASEHYAALIEEFPTYPAIAAMRIRVTNYQKFAEERKRVEEAQAKVRADSLAKVARADSLARMARADSIAKVVKADSLRQSAVRDSIALAAAPPQASVAASKDSIQVPAPADTSVAAAATPAADSAASATPSPSPPLETAVADSQAGPPAAESPPADSTLTVQPAAGPPPETAAADTSAGQVPGAPPPVQSVPPQAAPGAGEVPIAPADNPVRARQAQTDTTTTTEQAPTGQP